MFRFIRKFFRRKARQINQLEAITKTISENGRITFLFNDYDEWMFFRRHYRPEIYKLFQYWYIDSDFEGQDFRKIFSDNRRSGRIFLLFNLKQESILVYYYNDKSHGSVVSGNLFPVFICKYKESKL